MREQIALTDRLITGFCGNLVCTVAEFIDGNSDAFSDEEFVELLKDLATSGTTNVAIGGGHIELRLVTREMPDFDDCIDLVSWLAARGTVRRGTPLGQLAVEYQAIVDAARVLQACENAEPEDRP